MKLTMFAKLFISLVVLGLFGFILWTCPGFIPQKPTMLGGSRVPVLVNPTLGATSKCDGPEIPIHLPAWNAAMGLIYANGGVVTTPSSIMCQHGVRVRLIREDDTSKSFAAMAAFASRVKPDNPTPTEGAAGLIVMGDSAALHIYNANKVLGKSCVGFGCEAKIVGLIGFSAGEDAVLVSPKGKADMRGSYAAVVIGDGDWNLLMQAAAVNGIPVNQNTQAFDPKAINIFPASDYIAAADAYIKGQCENLLDLGTQTRGVRHCVDAVATWTPGDVNIAQKKGGLVSWISTAETPRQMPATLIFYSQWASDNPSVVANILAATFRANNEILASSEAKTKAAELSALVYREKDGAYWLKYATRHVETDAQGLQVPLGGSSVVPWVEANKIYTQGVYEAVYGSFGKLLTDHLPTLLPEIVPYKKAASTTYMGMAGLILKKIGQEGLLSDGQISTATPMVRVVGKRSWGISFATGTASLTEEASGTLTQIHNQILTTSGPNQIIEIHGHTDSVGVASRNMVLSSLRAEAIKNVLTAKGNVEAKAVRTFAHGDTKPVGDNSTPAGRAANRRVEIIIGLGG